MVVAIIVVIIVIILSNVISDSGSKVNENKRKQNELLKKYGARDKSLGVVGRNNDIIYNYLKQIQSGGYSYNSSEFKLSRDCFIDIYRIEGYGHLVSNADSWSISQIESFEASDKSIFKGLYEVIRDTFSKRKDTLNIKYTIGSKYSGDKRGFTVNDLSLPLIKRDNLSNIAYDTINKKDEKMLLLLTNIFDKLYESQGNLYYTINNDNKVYHYTELANMIEKHFIEDNIGNYYKRDIDKLLGGFFGQGFGNKDNGNDDWNGENIEDIIDNILIREESNNTQMFLLDGSGITAHELIDKFFMNDNDLLYIRADRDIPSSKTFYFEGESKAINTLSTKINNQCNQLISERSKKITDIKNRINEVILSHNNGLKGLKKLYEEGDKLGVESGVKYIVDGLYFDNFSNKDFDLLYDKESKSLIIEYHFPPLDDLPRLKEIKQNGKEMFFSDTAMKKLYDKYIFSICIRILYEIYNADYKNYIDGVIFNGIVTSIDKSNGHERTDYILSVSTEKKDIKDIILENIDPKETIRSLHGVCATSLSTLTPVPPISTIDKNDKRFVEGYNVIDSLDDSVNIACMDWQDFENLIRDLFEKIYGEKGGEVKVTQASRDGGVDAVAFDPDPVTGGKILIQAKRYTNVVGVGAVRDLAGAVHHEGAMKGILVTTSNFGHDAMKFVAKEPISLINGANLLSLLNKYGYHAHIDIKEARKILKEEEKKK